MKKEVGLFRNVDETADETRKSAQEASDTIHDYDIVVDIWDNYTDDTFKIKEHFKIRYTNFLKRF